MTEALAVTTAAVVVDASVAFKWFMSDGESGVAEALRLLDRHRDGEIALIAPEHLTLEVANSLLYRGLAADGVARALEALGSADLRWAPVNPALAARAAALARPHRLTVYDAAYVAVALDFDGVLVTADRRLAASGACRLRLI